MCFVCSKTGSGQNETDLDELCRQILELWNERTARNLLQSTPEKRRGQIKQRKLMGEGIREEALQRLGRRKTPSSPTASTSTTPTSGGGEGKMHYLTPDFESIKPCHVLSFYAYVAFCIELTLHVFDSMMYKSGHLESCLNPNPTRFLWTILF